MKRLEISIQSPTKTLQFPEVRLNRGLATYIDKEKVSGWLMPTPYMGSGASLDPKHLSTANIIQNFQNPKIEASPKEKEIYRNENAAEQISGSDNSHLYARLLSTANVIQNLPNPKVSTKNSLITPEMDASYLDAVEIAMAKAENVKSEDRLTKHKTEEIFGGIWIEDTKEFAKFASSVDTSPFEEDGEGIAFTDNYFYAYYRNIDGQVIPYASVYLNRNDSQDVVNESRKEIANVRKGERAKFYFDRAVVRFRTIQRENNANNGNHQSISLPVRNSGVVRRLLRKGRYYDNPHLYVKTPRTDGRRTLKPLYSLITPEMDATYLDAVERGDMTTAQKMVMEAAKLAMPNTKVVNEDGNPKVVYHGGQFGISSFIPKRNMHFGTKKAAMQRILDEQWGYDNWLIQNEDGSYSWKYEDEYDEANNVQSNKTFVTEEEAMEDALLYFGNEVVVKPYFLNIRHLERTDDAQSSWDDAIEVVKAESDNVDGIFREST